MYQEKIVQSGSGEKFVPWKLHRFLIDILPNLIYTYARVYRKGINESSGEVDSLQDWLYEKIMASVKWTDEQQSAIDKKGSNILVAAAARKW